MFSITIIILKISNELLCRLVRYVPPFRAVDELLAMWAIGIIYFSCSYSLSLCLRSQNNSDVDLYDTFQPKPGIELNVYRAV